MKKQTKNSKHKKDFIEKEYDDMEKDEEVIKFEDDTVRVPRPEGLTQAIRTHKAQNTEESKNQINQILIREYLNNNLIGIRKDKRLSIPELAIHLGMNEEELQKDLNNRMEKRNQFWANNEAANLYTRELLSALIFSTTVNLDLTTNQAQTMLKAQNGDYKAFVSGEVNRALANQTQATSAFQNLVMKLMDHQAKAQLTDQRLQVNILNQQETRQYITMEEASRLLENSNTQTMLNNPDLVPQMLGLPEVKAINQDLTTIGIKHDGRTNMAELADRAQRD